MSRHIALACAFFLTAPSLANAQTANEIGWTGAVELNGSNTTGNNETTNVGLQLNAKHRGTDWRHDFAFSADYGEDSGTTNKERLRVSYKVGRDISDRSYIFVNANYYTDDFAAFKNGTFFGGGYGYDVLIEGPSLWKLEVGAGYRSQKARLVPATPTDPVSETENFASLRLRSDFEYTLNENVKFNNDTELFYSEIDTFLINETAVTSKMFGSFALRASFRLETHSDVPVGREKTDTISRLGIVYTMN